MLELTQTANGLPLGTAVSSEHRLTPADFVDRAPAQRGLRQFSTHLGVVSYSPAFLLDARFDASITNDPEFHQACVSGFESGIEEGYGVDDRGREVFFGLNSVLTWEDLRTDTATAFREIGRFFPGIPPATLPGVAGFYLGRWSAVALTDTVLALRGLDLLCTLVETWISRQRKGI
jgi:hypothetical protein